MFFVLALTGQASDIYRSRLSAICLSAISHYYVFWVKPLSIDWHSWQENLDSNQDWDHEPKPLADSPVNDFFVDFRKCPPVGNSLPTSIIASLSLVNASQGRQYQLRFWRRVWDSNSGARLPAGSLVDCWFKPLTQLSRSPTLNANRLLLSSRLRLRITMFSFKGFTNYFSL